MPSIEDLLFLVQGGAMEPQDALGSYFSQQEEAKQRKRAERASVSDAMAQTFMGGAEQGMGLEQLLPLAQAQASFMGHPNRLQNDPSLGQGLESLFNQQGQSQIAPPDAGLTDQDRTSIYADAMRASQMRKPQGEVISAVMQRLSESGAQFDPLEVQKLITSAYSSAGF